MKIALVGQPNSGKSTFFNAVAGYRSLTSNFAGTTVEYTLGRARVNGEVFGLGDLAGIYSLTSANPAEACTRDYLFEEEWDVLIHIVDASQIARSLTLTLELLDLAAPLVLCLNMMDEATRKGMTIDSQAFVRRVGDTRG